MIKKGAMYFLMLLFLLAFVSAATTTVSMGTSQAEVDLEIELTRYSPAPVAPGEYFDLWITVSTEGSSASTSINKYSDITGAELEFVDNFPFSLDPGDDEIKSLGTLRMGEVQTLQYRVLVDDEATSGDNELLFIFRSDDDKDTLSPALELNVQVIDPTLNVVSIETVPEQLAPGQPATLDITIENDAGTYFKNIDMMLDIDGSDVPIVPYKSSKEQRLRGLDQGEQYTFSYTIIAEEDAEAGVYKIPFKMNYNDNNNTGFSKNDTFGLLIGAEGDLSFNLEEFDTFQKGVNGNFIVSVSNVGPTELKFMTLELLESEDYVVVGADKEYLGNLDSDDFETSSFDIHLDSNEDTGLNFLVNYKDVYNEAHEEEVSLTLPVYSNQEIAKYGLDGNGSSYYTYIVYLVLILFVYYFARGWRQEKRIDKAVSYGILEVIKVPFRVLFFFRPRKVVLWPKKIISFLRKL